MNRLFVLATIASAALSLSTTLTAAPFAISSGTTTTSTQTLEAGETGTIADGGTLSRSGGGNAITLGATAGAAATITNDGDLLQTGDGRAIRNKTSGTPSTIINNNASGLIRFADGDTLRADVEGSNWTVTNAGTIRSLNGSNGGAQAIDFNAVTSGTVQITNSGTIAASAADAIRSGANAIVSNSGTIAATPVLDDGDASGSDGIDTQEASGVKITNTGTISGRHGITGGENEATYSIGVTNNAGGTISGANGSGINIDGLSTTSVATVTNAQGGTIRGGLLPATISGDGDGIDVDGILDLDNSGDVLGYGSKGNGSDGGANNPEAIAIGGGTITNRATGRIVGSTLAADAPNGDVTRIGSGILVDDSSKGPAIAPTAVTNSGLIQGKTGNAIRLVGAQADTVTNNAGGTIRGAGDATTVGAAIRTGNGNDVVNNAGDITGDNGKAISLEGGDDTLNVTGGSISGDIDGGTETDTLNVATGAGDTFAFSGAITNVEITDVQSGAFDYTGAASLDGTIRVSGGTLLSNGGDLTGPLDFQSGTVGGTNLDGVDLTIGTDRTISPGNSPGTLATGNQTWAAGGTYLWEINALAADGGTPGANPGWDFTSINGSLDIAATTGGKFSILVDSLAQLPSWDPATSHSFKLASASGGITGFDAAAFAIASGSFADQHPLGGGSFSVAQIGNVIELRFAPVPEPGQWAAIATALLAFVVVRRARRSRV